MAFLGIDLGTTFSAVAYLDARGVPVTIPNAEGELTTPSVVLFESGGDVIVGREARRAALAEPHRVAEDVKRYMGDPFYPRLINGKQLTPVAISSLILKKLKQDAERKVGRVEGAVITVPAYFDEARRQATAEAGRLAGLNVLDIMNEPTSAALAYAFEGLSNSDAGEGREGRTPQEIRQALAKAPPRLAVVYDLGGGTFDVTALRMHGPDLTVLATAGDVRLGGRDWDERLFRLMADGFLRLHDLDPRDNPVSTQAIMLAAEETKKVLSLRRQAMYVVNHEGRSFTGEVTREEFDVLTEDLLYRTESRLSRVVAQAGLTWQQVDTVLLVGGSTRMPQVQHMLRRVTGKQPDTSLSPDEAVAHGAAIHAAACAVKLADEVANKPKPAATPPTLPPTLPRPAIPAMPPGDAAKGKLPAVNQPPATAPSPRPALPADELKPEAGGLLRVFRNRVVELLRSLRTVNVNAHSLGVVATTQEGRQRVSVLVPQNTQLPVSVTKRFGTVSDNQPGVTVRVVEGESKEVEECMPVGLCRIQQLPAGLPRGSPVDVTFTYDNSGRLHVKAMEVKSGNWATVLIQRRSGATRPRAEVEAEELVAKARVS